MFDTFDLISPDSLKGVQAHPSAQIAKTAELGANVRIGPGAIIGPQVKLGDEVKVGAYAIIEGKTTIGRNSAVHSFATLGTPPQDRKFKGEPTELIVGENNHFREYVNVSLGTVTGNGRTVIGNDNWILAYVHIAHDCHIGNNCTFSNGVNLAGHVTVQDNVVFGGMSGGHQFCRFGRNAMVGAGSIVVQDVAPYCMVQGDHARTVGLNVIGLKRAGIASSQLQDIKTMFKLVFQSNLTLETAVQRIAEEVGDSPYKTVFLDFIKESPRGLCR